MLTELDEVVVIRIPLITELRLFPDDEARIDDPALTIVASGGGRRQTG